MRFRGLDLDVYPSDTKVLNSPDEYREAARSDSLIFVRTLGIFAPGYNSLREVLDVSQGEFEKVAEYSDCEVVGPEEWAFFDNRDQHLVPNSMPAFSYDLLPKGYLLVAKVAIIEPLIEEGLFRERLTKLDSITKGINRYQSEQRVARLFDIRSDSFTVGKNRTKSTAQTGWLTDIEPRLWWKD